MLILLEAFPLLLLNGIEMGWADEVNDLIKQLQDKNAKFRFEAAIALELTGDARAVEALIKGFCDEDEVL